mgnify:CR=1 FL=1
MFLASTNRFDVIESVDIDWSVATGRASIAEFSITIVSPTHCRSIVESGTGVRSVIVVETDTDGFSILDS